MNYENFDLEAAGYVDRDNAESFTIRVVNSPAGQQKASSAERVSLPIEARTQVRLLERRGLARPGMVRLGAMFGDALFPPTVRRLFDASRIKIGDNKGLRIRLRFDHFALANLPWEYSYLARPDGQADALEGFLALDRQLSIVRYEVMGQSARTLAPAQLPIRFVALLSSPQNLEGLKVDRERVMLEQSLNTLPAIQQEYYPRASVDALLDAFAQPAHVLHFAGHGLFEQAPGERFGSRDGKGYLIFEDDARRAVPISAERLALALKNRGVRLAVLGACQTGLRDSSNPWTGVAPALVRAGIPAVIGMQFKVYDTSAVAFNRQFYQALVQGHEIDFAVSAGRLAMLAKLGDDDRDWGVPVLYMRSDNGVIFPADGALGTGAAFDLPPARTIGSGSVANPLRARSAVFAAPTAVLNLGGAAETHQLKIRLRDILNGKFNMADLEVLCHSLGVEFEEIAGQTRLMKSLNIVEHLARRERLPDLVAIMRAMRPGVL
jgi:CHAT domain/Effector-associated domain 7